MAQNSRLSTLADNSCTDPFCDNRWRISAMKPTGKVRHHINSFAIYEKTFNKQSRSASTL